MHILIVRPGAIGDTLLTLPVIQALRAEQTNPHITLVGNAAVLPLALQSGLVEEVSDYGELRWSEFFAPGGVRRTDLRARLQQTDLAICWLRDPQGVVERNLGAAGVRRCVVAPGHPPRGERIHVVDYLAGSIGLSPAAALHTFTLAASAARPDPGSPGRPTVAIHPGSGGAHKCWPVASFAALIEQLWRRGASVLLLIGPAEQERWQSLRGLLPPPPSPATFNLLANAPLAELAAQLRQCACYLGNDSGITHLAALLGLPTIALFGPSDPATWRPLGQVEVIQARPLEHLPVNRVMQSIVRMAAVNTGGA
jgi:heptosyltransferase III